MSILTTLALAAGTGADQVNIPAQGADVTVQGILNLLYFLAGVVAVIVIIIAGFSMVVSGSNPTSIGKARNAILYSVIGIIVILSAFMITQFVRGRF